MSSLKNEERCTETTSTIEQEKTPRKLRMRYNVKSDLDGGYWTNETVGAMMEAKKQNVIK